MNVEGLGFHLDGLESLDPVFGRQEVLDWAERRAPREPSGCYEGKRATRGAGGLRHHLDAIAQPPECHVVTTGTLAGRSVDRETWLDDRLPAQGQAAVMPGVVTGGARWGGTEVLQFWNERLDRGVAWNGPVAPVPPGYVVVWSELGTDGLARWAPRPQWLAAHRDDPRVRSQARSSRACQFPLRPL